MGLTEKRIEKSSVYIGIYSNQFACTSFYISKIYEWRRICVIRPKGEGKLGRHLGEDFFSLRLLGSVSISLVVLCCMLAQAEYSFSLPLSRLELNLYFIKCKYTCPNSKSGLCVLIRSSLDAFSLLSALFAEILPVMLSSEIHIPYS